MKKITKKVNLITKMKAFLVIIFIFAFIKNKNKDFIPYFFCEIK